MDDFGMPAPAERGDTPPTAATVAEWIGYGRLAMAVGHLSAADAMLARAQRVLLAGAR
jgi:hypothetical protein